MKAAPSGRGFLAGSRLLAELALPQVAAVAAVEVAAVGTITTPEAVMATVTVTAMVVETVMAMAMVAIRQRQHLTHQMCRLLPV